VLSTSLSIGHLSSSTRGHEETPLNRAQRYCRFALAQPSARATFSMCNAACTTARSTPPRAGIRSAEFRIPPALLERMKTLGTTGEWIFHARGGVPLNPGNSLKRYIRPVAKELNIELGGWHDFRHTVATSMLRACTVQKSWQNCWGTRIFRSRFGPTITWNPMRSERRTRRQTSCYETCYEY